MKPLFLTCSSTLTDACAQNTKLMREAGHTHSMRLNARQWRSTASGTRCLKLAQQKSVGGRRRGPERSQVAVAWVRTLKTFVWTYFYLCFSDIKVSPTGSSISPTTISSPSGSNRRAAVDLSISSIHTTTPLTVESSSAINTPRKWTYSDDETVHSHSQKRGKQHRVKFVPQLPALTELDELWKKFLSLSMMEKENMGVGKCSCSVYATNSTNTADTRRESDLHHTSDSPSTKTPPYSSTTTKGVLVERAVQTSPLVTYERQHTQCRVPPPPSSPSVMFTVASQRAARPRLGELSLSEAFALSHPEFIEASLRRQREIKQRQQLKTQGGQTDAFTKPRKRPHSYRHSQFHSHTSESKCIMTLSLFSLSLSLSPLSIRQVSNMCTQYYFAVGHGQSQKRQYQRNKISKREMYDASRRVWSQLPEVQAKKSAEKRKSRAQTYRIRIKLYQEVSMTINLKSFLQILGVFLLTGGALKTEETK